MYGTVQLQYTCNMVVRVGTRDAPAQRSQPPFVDISQSALLLPEPSAVPLCDDDFYVIDGVIPDGEQSSTLYEQCLCLCRKPHLWQ